MNSLTITTFLRELLLQLQAKHQRRIDHQNVLTFRFMYDFTAKKVHFYFLN